MCELTQAHGDECHSGRVFTQQAQHKGILRQRQVPSRIFCVVKSQVGENLKINWDFHKDNFGNIIARAVLIFPPIRLLKYLLLFLMNF